MCFLDECWLNISLVSTLGSCDIKIIMDTDAQAAQPGSHNENNTTLIVCPDISWPLYDRAKAILVQNLQDCMLQHPLQ